MNLMMSEMRMIELGGGVVAATNSEITVRVPAVSGVACASGGTLTVTRLPADLSAVAGVGFSGFAYRAVNGVYTYVEGPIAPIPALAAVCAAAGLLPNEATPGVLADGSVYQVATGAAVPVGSPVFLYNIITYAFAASTSVPGRLALWRELDGAPPEELVAPFDNTAQFRFFVNDVTPAQTAVPGTLSTITGVEIVLDGVSERPSSDGTYQTVPLTTAVFFKNR
jgi:hypothetical protein